MTLKFNISFICLKVSNAYIVYQKPKCIFSIHFITCAFSKIYLDSNENVNKKKKKRKNIICTFVL